MRRTKRAVRAIIIICMAAALGLLSGCQRNILSSRRDMEKLRPIQTMGVDRQGDGVMVSVSSGIGPEGDPPLVMKCAASGMETAIARLQDYSPEDELFYANVQYILLGETIAGDSVMPLLDWVERSPAMRTGTELFLVKGNADAAVTAAAGEETDITERLASLEREEDRLGQHIYTLREVASSLAERGCALCLAVESYPPDNVIYTASKAAAIVPVGYAVLRDGALTAYLSQNETLGVELIRGEATGSHFTVDENTLEVLECDADVSGRWGDGGSLDAIDIRCTLKSGVREREQGGEEDPAVLQADMQTAVLECLTAVLARSQTLACDFLDLESAVLKTAPGHRLPDQARWQDIFPALPIAIEVKGEINRSYDLSD